MIQNLPQIRKDQNGELAFYVDGKEFLVLGGEVHNSTASDMEYMEEYVWKKLGELPLNTLLVTVCWEQVEREKGKYDFSLASQIIDRARQKGIRLIFLWFGLWKNGASNYIPAWMKKDSRKYFRACYQGGVPSGTISPLCKEAVNEDKKAFAAFMAFLREYDSEQHTVIMVQVENEVGFLGSDRDYSPQAQKEYQKNIPVALEQLYGVSGTWKEAFGEQAPEHFMTWYFASAVEEIAAAGKKEYPLPLYVNVWLDLFPFRAGTYPSGGPITKMISMWKAVAGSIDLIAPDIYDSDLFGICEQYHGVDNPLFIPETGRQPKTASNLFGVLGLYHAIGFSPFGIDDMLNAGRYEHMNRQELEDRRIDWRWDRCLEENNAYLRQGYLLANEMKSLYFREKKKCIGFAKKNEHDRGAVIPFEKFDVILRYPDGAENRAGSAGMLIPISDKSFYLVGCNAQVEVVPKGGEEYQVELAAVWEGTFRTGEFVRGRKLNGDELHAQCRLTDLPSAIQVEVELYE